MNMRTRPRHRATVAAGAAAAMLLAGCGPLVAGSEVETVLIGVDLELTGGGEALGAVYRQALELRVEQVNQQELLGNRRLEVEIRDNRSDPATSAQNIVDFADEVDVDVIITGGCGPCVAASAPEAEQRGVPLVSLAAVDPATPAEERRFLFKVGPNAEDNAAALVAELTRSGDVSTVGLVATDDEYGEAGVDAFADAADRAGLDLVVTPRVDPAAGEEALAGPAGEVANWTPPDQFIPPGQAPEEAGPDATVLWLAAPLAERFAVALRDAGYDEPLFLDPLAADQLFLSGSAGDALAGATLIFTETLVMDTVLATSPAKAERKAWFNTYSARYGTYHAQSSFAADAVQLILEVVDQLEEVEREAIRDAMERTQLDGISGPLRITPDNHSALTSVALVPLVASDDRWQAAS